MGTVESRIADNLAGVRDRIASAAARAERSPDEIRLIAVTKYVDAELTRAMFSAGCRALGESRPQELWAKAEALSEIPIEWHMIGHLQRNKAKRTLRYAQMIHSVDSERLLATLEREIEPDRELPVLLEVNTSGDEDKHGFRPADMPAVIDGLAKLQRVRVVGLMTMAGRTTGLEGARRDFASLRELRDQLRANCPESITLDELSMGMSGDFEVAVEEGATMVRIGSVLFEGIDR